jgi:hypothetical protein
VSDYAFSRAQQAFDARLPPDEDERRERYFERECFAMGMWTINELKDRAGSFSDELNEILDQIAWERVNADD